MKKILIIVAAFILILTPLLAGVTSVAAWVDPGPGDVSNSLDMHYVCTSSCWCGPSSGSSIGRYYDSIKGYGFLPGNSGSWLDMYNRLYEYMETQSSGYTDPTNYGSGFVEMALHYGYDNFGYANYSTVTLADYSDIVEAIDNGWPIALASMRPTLGFAGVPAISTDEQHPTHHWPCTQWHWIVIKGYFYYIDHWDGPGTPVITTRQIYCTDSWSWANNLVLDWNTLVNVVGASNLRAYIIKDVDPENDGYVEGFEWGSDGASLNNWETLGGQVDWYSYAYGSSRVEIDNAQKHTGSVSALFYRSSYSPYAYYQLKQPSYIGFCLKNDWTVYPEFRNGDGNYAIRVRVGDVERIEYYDGTWHPSTYSLQAKWNWIEFRNINWSTHTFDIYVDGYLWKTGATMWHYSGYNGRLYFGSWTGSGTFWIDSITDSLRPL
ncbi:MAG: hypothetical protein MUO80_06175 [Dehalococcoidia bacterium]|nr:hypothetical protein [Dehalococcoidia bacterium]